MALEEALERAILVYKKEQRHAAPTDVVAQDMGYKSANSGAALSALATLRSYGLLERIAAGKVAVTEAVESYRYAPNEELKRKVLIDCLLSPPVFSELLDKYQGTLPSDSTVTFDLMQMGFKPGTADSVLKAFKESVEFAGFYDRNGARPEDEDEGEEKPNEDSDIQPDHAKQSIESATKELIVAPSQNDRQDEANHDRIPVRLDSKRRAWLEIPMPFYEADKKRIKAQIDLLITDDESDEEDT